MRRASLSSPFLPLILILAAGVVASGCGSIAGWQKRREARALEESIAEQKASLRKMSRAELERAEAQSREKAIAQYEKILTEYSDVNPGETDEALYLLGRLLFDREQEAFEDGQARHEAGDLSSPPLPRYPQAKAVFERLLREFPESAFREDALYDLGYILNEEGDLTGAASYFRDLIANYPDSRYAAEVHFRLGEEAFEGFDLTTAGEHYQASLDQGESEFTEKALFKLAWVLYNQDRYDEAKSVLATLLDRQVATVEKKGGEFAPTPILFFPGPRRAASEKIGEPKGDLYQETLEIIARVYMESGGVDALVGFLESRRRGAEAPPYAAPLLHRLALVEKERAFLQAAENTYRKLLDTYPTFRDAPVVENELVEMLLEQGRKDDVARVRERMIERYDEGSAWARANPEEEYRVVALEKAREGLEWAIAHFHAQGLEKQKESAGVPDDLRHALELYEKYLARFPEGEPSYERRFRYGQALFAAGELARAADTFRVVSFDETFDARREEAAFARILSVEKLAEGKEPPLPRPLIDDLVAAYEEYVALNPASDKNAALVFKEGQLYFDAELYPQAIAAFERVVDKWPRTPFATEANDLVAQAHFRLGQFAVAESWAEKALSSSGGDSPLAARRDEVENLFALTMFRQGETADEEKRHGEATGHFLRLVERLPRHETAPRALYNAASATAEAEEADRAAALYERLLAEYAEHDLAPDAAVRLAAHYKGQPDGAAKILRVYESVADHHVENPKGEEFLFLAGKLAVREKKPGEMRRIFSKFLDRYPSDRNRTTYAHYHLGVESIRAGDVTSGRTHLERFLSSPPPAGDVFGDGAESHAYAQANAQLLLGNLAADEYRAARILEPVAQSLKKKEALLDALVARFAPVVRSGLSPLATEAAFRTGQAYEDFGQAVRSSPRPAGLSAEERAEYDLLLEGHVRPWLVKAVDAYRGIVRASRQQDVEDEWVLRCRKRLGELAPSVFARSPDPGYRSLDGTGAAGIELVRTWNGAVVKPGSGPGFFGSLFASDEEKRKGEFTNGLAAADEGKWDEALAAFRKSGSGGAPEAAINAAAILVSRGDVAAARVLVENVLRDRRDFTPALALAGTIAEKSGDTVDAVTYYREATAAADAPAEHWVRLGAVLEKAEQPEEALEAYREALGRNGQSAEAAIGVARLESASAGSARLERLIPSLARSPDKLVELGILAAENGEPRVAGQAFAAARSSITSGDRSALGVVVLNQALAALETGELERAERFLQEGRTLETVPAATHNAAGLLEMRAGRFEKAESDFRNALEVDPRFPAPWRNLGILQELYLAEPDGAVQSYRQYLALRPDGRSDVEGWIQEIGG